MWVLILVVATSSVSDSGAAAVQQEFASQALCRSAGTELIRQAEKRDNYILTWGCFEKGAAK